MPDLQSFPVHGSEPAPLVVLSPHLDDAVLSCGAILGAHPGSIVVTVYAGMPAHPEVLTSWDGRCGFSSAAQAMHCRWNENRAALALLGSSGIELDFIDCQYQARSELEPGLLAQRLLRMLARCSAARVAIPLGLFHDDHVSVSNTGLSLMEAWPDASWLAYEDVPYRNGRGAVQDRLTQLYVQGLAATPAQPAMDASRQPEAISAYASQLRGLRQDAGDLAGQDHYWSLAPMGRPE